MFMWVLHVDDAHICTHPPLTPDRYRIYVGYRVFLYTPFYLIAGYAFVRQRIWIQPWCLFWAGAVLATTAVTWIDNFWGSVTSEPEMYFSINGVPVAVCALINGARVDTWHTYVHTHVQTHDRA